jgi:hypothetical protein
MAVKHTFAAGVAALTLLFAPVGLTIQWSEHGPAMSTTPAISTVHAANRPTPKKAPSNGGPAFTSGGATQKTTGWQTPGGMMTDNQCQAVADKFDEYTDNMIAADIAGDYQAASDWGDKAIAILGSGEKYGCAFTGPMIPA